MKRQGGFRNLFTSMFSRVHGSRSNEADTVNEVERDNVQQ